MKSRTEQLNGLLALEPTYRAEQIRNALASPEARMWEDVTVLPKALRGRITKAGVPFLAMKEVLVQVSKKRDTIKAALKLVDGKAIETVLMRNPRGHWTVCVSSQVGCAMQCMFCATGKMGLTRGLNADEIIDQVRFWQRYLADHKEMEGAVTNVVFMGMGEPLVNYTNVRAALAFFINDLGIGMTRITVSTVGVLPRLEKILTDPHWPHVRLAVSLHAADARTRADIMPSSFEAFLPTLADWSRRYLAKYGNRRHHLTFEYIMLRGVNDTPRCATALAKFVTKIGKVRVNLIPYNSIGGTYESSKKYDLIAFEQALERHGITVIRRRTMGDDISAACGQLILEANRLG